MPGREAERLADELGRLVDMMGALERLPGEPSVGAEGPDAAPRRDAEADDLPGPCLDREIVRANAPRMEDGFFRVPPHLERQTGDVSDSAEPA